MRTIGRPRRGRRRVVGLVAATTVLASVLGMSASIADPADSGTGAAADGPGSGTGLLAAPGAWLVGADGGVFRLGRAKFLGETGG